MKFINFFSVFIICTFSLNADATSVKEVDYLNDFNFKKQIKEEIQKNLDIENLNNQQQDVIGNLIEEEEIKILDIGKSYTEKPKARIIVLNKITARTETYDIKKDESIELGSLTFKLHGCYKPNNTVMEDFVSKVEVRQPKDNKEIYYGWLLSKNKALGYVQHPIYDFILKKCL